jgi:hypothetical protein
MTIGIFFSVPISIDTIIVYIAWYRVVIILYPFLHQILEGH